MSGSSLVGYTEGELIADSSSYKLRMVGPWMLLFGAANLDTSVDLRALESNLGLKLGWRTAPVRTDGPDAWEGLGTERTTNASFLETFDASAKTSHLWVQGAAFTALTTGSTPKTVRTRLWTTPRDAGWVAARQRFVLTPSSANNIILPIGNPFNCAGVTGLMFGFIFQGVSGTIDNPSCVWRSFDTGDPKQPNAWSTALSTLTDVTADTSANSGTLAITTSGKIMAQPGFKYSTTGTDPNATVDIIVAAKQ